MTERLDIIVEAIETEKIALQQLLEILDKQLQLIKVYSATNQSSNVLFASAELFEAFANPTALVACSARLEQLIAAHFVLAQYQPAVTLAESPQILPRCLS